MIPSSSSSSLKHQTDSENTSVYGRYRESNGPDPVRRSKRMQEEKQPPLTSSSPADGPAGSPVQPTCRPGDVCRLSAAIQATIARLIAVCRTPRIPTRRVLAPLSTRLPVARYCAGRPAWSISKALTRGEAHRADTCNSRMWIHQREKEHRRNLQKRASPASVCMCLAVLRHGRGGHTSGVQRAAMTVHREACVARRRAGCSTVANPYRIPTNPYDMCTTHTWRGCWKPE